MQPKVTIRGLKELDAVLAALPRKLERNVLNGALRAAGNTVAKEIRGRAPVGSDDPHPKYGRLKDNIRVRMVRSARRFAVGTGRAFWAKFVEFGTAARRIRKKKVMSDGKVFYGTDVAPMPARPFFRPGWDASKQRALKNLVERLRRGIESQVKKLRGKT
jgi:HK97 gp10 family phage protein